MKRKKGVKDENTMLIIIDYYIMKCGYNSVHSNQ
jgi:hypothetical protein